MRSYNVSVLEPGSISQFPDSVAALFELTDEERRSTIEAALFSTDYRYASGRIDVLDRGETVRSSRFIHDSVAQRRWDHCSVENLTYTGRGCTGELERADGRLMVAQPAIETRDIPDWLLCPMIAPIWGRPGEQWRADTTAAKDYGDHIKMPLWSSTASGFAEIAWPDGHFSKLCLGDETYVVRELDWQPTERTL